MLLEIVCRFGVLFIVSSRHLQVVAKLGIERSKFGVELNISCIPDVSGISSLRQIYLFFVLTLVVQVLGF